MEALEAGFQIHLTKPVQPAELAAVVASLAGLGRRAQGVRATTQESSGGGFIAAV